MDVHNNAKAHNAAMDPDLGSVVTALTDLHGCELDALLVTVDECPQFAPGLLAWIEHLCDWEQNRRQGLDLG